MILCIADLLPDALLAETCAVLASSTYRDGRQTAGWHASQVKNNLQIAPGNSQVAALQQKLLAQISAHHIVATAMFPRRFCPLLFNRYETGMSYGSHVDDALMRLTAPGQDAVRTDISFTIFLSPPESYEGGELVIETSAGEQVFKLEAGQALFYPSGSLHRVMQITGGVRDAAVGWVQSYIRDAGQRETLFELDRVRRHIFKRDGKCPEFDGLSKIYSNLLRGWAEV
ncbi:MAG: Fe2+-dependent dioxygenase [Pseudomonadota bacterium]